MESEFEKDVRMMLARPPFSFRNVPKEALALFCTALTHDSYASEAGNEDPPRRVQSYERLEFLGDAVLELIACEHVFRGTDWPEGPMTDFKIDKVKNENISDRVLEKGLPIDALMRVGGGHLGPHGAKAILPNMRADCFEAVVAATYISYGLEEARRVVFDILLT